jgi:hypothetical protein
MRVVTEPSPTSLRIGVRILKLELLSNETSSSPFASQIPKVRNACDFFVVATILIIFYPDATKFKETFEKCGKGDFTGLEVIKQDAEDAAKAAEDSKKEEKKAD